MDKSNVPGEFIVRGNAQELAGEDIYWVMHDLWLFPEWCDAPACPRYWMQNYATVKVSGDFMGSAFACVDGAHYELMFLYGVTDAGRTGLRNWLWDTQSRARPELPPKADVIVLGSNLEVTADHGLGPPPAGCSAAGAAP